MSSFIHFVADRSGAPAQINFGSLLFPSRLTRRNYLLGDTRAKITHPSSHVAASSSVRVTVVGRGLVLAMTVRPGKISWHSRFTAGLSGLGFKLQPHQQNAAIGNKY